MTSRPRVRASGVPLTISIVSSRRHAALARGLASWLARAAPRAARGAIAIALVTDRVMRDLNRRFRGVDAPTDVLSFASADEPARAGRPIERANKSRNLGELAIATGVAARQARREGHATRVEVRVLALHGLLHLLGYDHERDHGTMRKVEARLRRRAGLPAGLIERTPGRSRRR